MDETLNCQSSLDIPTIFLQEYIHAHKWVSNGDMMANDNDDRNDESNRTSIWSVRTEDRLQFSVIFFSLFIAGMITVSWYEIWIVDNKNVMATVIALIKDVGAVGIASLTITLVRFEGGEVVGIGLEWYKKQRYNAGYEAGEEVGRAAGIEVGRVAGIEEGRRLEREAQRKRQANDNADVKDSNDDPN